jgi:hypothetical protein
MRNYGGGGGIKFEIMASREKEQLRSFSNSILVITEKRKEKREKIYINHALKSNHNTFSINHALNFKKSNHNTFSSFSAIKLSATICRVSCRIAQGDGPSPPFFIISPQKN